jgi:hypothetical protein
VKCYKCRFGPGRTRYYITNYSNNDEYAWCDRGDPYWTIGGQLGHIVIVMVKASKK